MTKAPRLLLFTDVVPSEGGMGASRTLFNIFKHWPKEQLAIVTWREGTGGPCMGCLNITVRHDLPGTPGRLRSKITALPQSPLRLFHRFQARSTRRRIREFSPDVAIVFGQDSDLFALMERTLGDNIPYVVYLMDDIIENREKRNAPAGRVIRGAKGWICISSALAEIIRQKWGGDPKPFIVAHNPVEAIEDEDVEIAPTHPFIAYAGSIWPMHYDALLATAKAVDGLRAMGERVELRIFTAQTMWERYKATLGPLGCVWGGFIHPRELNKLLKQASLLLVCSSFMPELETFSRGSLQTKMTDYMAVGKPIISVGPSYSICGRFVEEWKCGVFYPISEPTELAKAIRALLLDETRIAFLGRSGKAAVVEHFSAEKISQRVYRFITELYAQDGNGRSFGAAD